MGGSAAAAAAGTQPALSAAFARRSRHKRAATRIRRHTGADQVFCRSGFGAAGGRKTAMPASPSKSPLQSAGQSSRGGRRRRSCERRNGAGLPLREGRQEAADEWRRVVGSGARPVFVGYAASGRKKQRKRPARRPASTEIDNAGNTIVCELPVGSAAAAAAAAAATASAASGKRAAAARDGNKKWAEDKASSDAAAAAMRGKANCSGGGGQTSAELPAGSAQGPAAPAEQADPLLLQQARRRRQVSSQNSNNSAGRVLVDGSSVSMAPASAAAAAAAREIA